MTLSRRPRVAARQPWSPSAPPEAGKRGPTGEGSRSTVVLIGGCLRFSLQTACLLGITLLILVEWAVAWHLTSTERTGSRNAGLFSHLFSSDDIRFADATRTSDQLIVPTELTETDADNDVFDPQPDLWEFQLGQYTFKTVQVVSNDDHFIRLEVWKGDSLVYQEDGNRFELPWENEADDDRTNSFFEPGANVTGNGLPDVIVSEYSGGAHCCSTYYIFELGDEFRLIAEIPAEHGGIEMVDLNHDGVPAIKMTDWSYAYAFGCFASSPTPDLILRYTNGTYSLAADLMATPAPGEEQLQAMAAEIKSNYYDMVENRELDGEWAAESGLWQHMLDLIYAGHEDEARHLYDLAWPDKEEGKDDALETFAQTVANSTFWQAMYGPRDAPTNGVEAALVRASDY
jgi:hypothetical protein